MSDITKSMTDAAIVSELYERIETRRKNSNITQAEMAERIGITTKSYRAIQKGVCRLTTFVALLRQLDLVENLNGLISTPKISPLQMKFSASTAQRRSAARKLKNEPVSALSTTSPSTTSLSTSALATIKPDSTSKDENLPTLRAVLLGQREKLLIKDK